MIHFDSLSFTFIHSGRILRRPPTLFLADSANGFTCIALRRLEESCAIESKNKSPVFDDASIERAAEWKKTNWVGNAEAVAVRANERKVLAFLMRSLFTEKFQARIQDGLYQPRQI